MPALNPPYDQAAQNQRAGDDWRVEEISLDLFMNQCADGPRGDKGDDEIEGQALRPRLRGQVFNQLYERLAIEPDHGQDGAQLHEDGECLGQRAFEAYETLGQNKMAGGRNGQKFGDTLNNAEDDRFDDVYEHDTPWKNEQPSPTRRVGPVLLHYLTCPNAQRP